ncbi:MAG: hypothetical protein EBU90_15120 [Proteobacteria bacterium]|nr:hypothetical protein [Pseudomonadota bacterium]NBP14422.1 hypothetical protein [bacterium]
MSYETLTFWLYIQQQCGTDIEKFKGAFGSQIDMLPNKVVSSRTIRKVLTVDTIQKEILFRKVWMEYFKTKLNGA